MATRPPGAVGVAAQGPHLDNHCSRTNQGIHLPEYPPGPFSCGVEETVVTLHFRDGGEEPQAGQDSWAGELVPTHCYQLSPGPAYPAATPPTSPPPALNLLGSFTLGCQAHGTPFSYYDIHTASLNHVTESSIDLTVSCNTRH